MKPIELKRWIVGLDLTDTDQNLLNYTKYLSRLLGPKKIYFVHVIRTYETPEALGLEPEEREEPLDEVLAKRINEKIHGFGDIETDVKVCKGSPTPELLEVFEDKKADLLIVGRKAKHLGSGTVPQQLSRKVSGSVLFVPEEVQPQINRILVPTDFSESALQAAQVALDLARATAGNPHVVLYHDITVSAEWMAAGESFSEYLDKKVHEYTQKAWTQLRSKLNTKDVQVSFETTEGNYSGAEKAILGKAKEGKFELVVMGARGRTPAASLLLGSITEKFIALNAEVPALVVRDKSQKITFAQAFLGDY